MADFSKFLDVLKDNIAELAKTNVKEYAESAIKDGESFIKSTKSDLELWTKQLISGELSKKDFEWLLKSKKDLAEMTALMQAGLAKARIDKFRTDVLKTISSTAFKTFL